MSLTRPGLMNRNRLLHEMCMRLLAYHTKVPVEDGYNFMDPSLRREAVKLIYAIILGPEFHRQEYLSFGLNAYTEDGQDAMDVETFGEPKVWTITATWVHAISGVTPAFGKKVLMFSAVESLDNNLFNTSSLLRVNELSIIQEPGLCSESMALATILTWIGDR